MLNHFIKLLLPRSDQFLVLLSEAAQNLWEGAQVLQKLSFAQSEEEIFKIVRELKDVEHRGDEITRTILEDLNQTFVTPLDREDIHALTTSLDDVLDYIFACGEHIQLFKLKTLTEDMKKLVSIIVECTEELRRAVPLLKNLRDLDQIKARCIRLSKLETEGDDAFRQAMSRLFEKIEDPVEIIKQKDILEAMENAIDKCRDAADVLWSVVISNA
jgi:predicted phosphate transport protein (TIGR00153 family)